MAGGAFAVTHLDVESGQASVFAAADENEEFGHLASRYQAWMVEPDLLPDIDSLRQLRFENLRAIAEAMILVYSAA
jgi:putative aminopeptidase FrvX